MTMSLTSAGCSTTVRMRVLPFAAGSFDTRCKHAVGSYNVSPVFVVIRGSPTCHLEERTEIPAGLLRQPGQCGPPEVHELAGAILRCNAHRLFYASRRNFDGD